MSTVVKDLGAVSAYAYAVEKGYTGTEAEFAELMADYAEVGQRAEDAADSALESKTAAQTAATTATNKASEATTAATTATTKAGEASQSASQAQSSAQTASTKASEASASASTASAKATEATTAAETASTAATNAQAAQTAAETAQGKAEDAHAAAEAVAESIPSDYSQLSEDVSDLKEEFTALESDGAVPTAEQILSDKGITDSVPYHYRATGGDGADRLYDQIVGGSLAVNQLAGYNATAGSTTSSGVTFTINSDGSVDVSGEASAQVPFNIGTRVDGHAGHVRFVKGCPIGGSTSSYALKDGYGNVRDIGNGCIDKINSDYSIAQIIITSGYSITGTLKFKPQIFDLTAMFGTTIADYVYTLESATAGAGVAWLKAHFPKIFDSGYIPYNAGTLEHVSGLSAHKMTGFNQWDEEWEIGSISSVTGQNTTASNIIRAKDYIPVFPDTEYFMKTLTSSIVYYYDLNKNFIGTGLGGSVLSDYRFTTSSTCHFIRFRTSADYGATYNHDICINLSDPARNGEYEPYKAHSYPLDSTLTLRGIPKLSDGKMYYDGDRYLPDGTVERRYGIRAYQSGDESLADAITDGINTVYKLTTTTIEEVTPYRQLQICDPNGTEEFVSTGIVPVGHETRYPDNLRAKIDGLPWDFSSLIAPTEKSTTASHNYTTGSLLIMGNVLYKVTANIANGGTITPNTNVTATTLSEILGALAQ